MKKLLVSLVAMLAVTAAFAMPTMLGATGGLMVENAKIGEKIVVGSYLLQFKKLMIPSVTLTVPVAALTEEKGALDNIELSAAYTNDHGVNFTSFGAKYVLPLEFEGAAIAIGGNYIDNGDKTVYVSGTYAVPGLGIDLTAQGAYGFNSKNSYLNANIEKDFEDFAVGIDYVNALSSFDVYVTSDKFLDGFGVTAALVNVGSKRSAKFVAGISYAF